MDADELGASFRQSRREMFVMLSAWIVFVTWTGTTCALLSRFDPEQPAEILFGMPKWALLGIAAPWIASNIFIFWFALCFMKDTKLGPDSDAAAEGKNS